MSTSINLISYNIRNHIAYNPLGATQGKGQSLTAQADLSSPQVTDQYSLNHFASPKLGEDYTKSDVLMQIKADVLGCEISILKNRDAGIASLAMICAVADGVYSNYVEAAEKFVHTTKKYLPEKSKHEFYSEKYRKYKIIRETMKRLYNEI